MRRSMEFEFMGIDNCLQLCFKQQLLLIHPPTTEGNKVVMNTAVDNLVSPRQHLYKRFNN